MLKDNYDLWKEYDEAVAEWVYSRPECTICGEHITDDSAIYLDGWICERCIEERRRYID